MLAIYYGRNISGLIHWQRLTVVRQPHLPTVAVFGARLSFNLR